MEEKKKVEILQTLADRDQLAIDQSEQWVS